MSDNYKEYEFTSLFVENDPDGSLYGKPFEISQEFAYVIPIAWLENILGDYRTTYEQFILTYTPYDALELYRMADQEDVIESIKRW